ncbi:MAG: carbon-nitrogen hydrolase family protein [Phycisphaerae bacterium]|nr:carbon-nitrogen hydrolase family protein [Phycisphaerae bacterium]
MINKKHFGMHGLLAVVICVAAVRTASALPDGDNCIGNGAFEGPLVNGLPAGWVAKAARPSLSPVIRVVDKQGQRYLHMAGGGNPDAVGGVSTQAGLVRGKTYWFRVRFQKSACLNPIQHLLFEVTAQGSSQQIVEFHRLAEGWVEGEARVSFPGGGPVQAEVRAVYRLCADGEVWIETISLVETDPVPPRWVRIACTGGPDTLEKYGLPAFRDALDSVGRVKVDLVLLPEYFSGEYVQETLSGPSATLMSEKARQYRMYVAGTIGLYDEASDRLFNTALLFDRTGKQVGRYDKIHLYGPELLSDGVTPGDDVPVFETDFGKLGFMTCYDSWFTDVAELVALRGADILLFPSLNYDRALMHARSLDNGIHIVASSRAGGGGVWDAAGRDVLRASTDTRDGSTFRDVVKTQVDGLDIWMVTLDLNTPLIGGRRSPTIRTKRHLANQRNWLEDQIRQEKDRWWVD